MKKSRSILIVDDDPIAALARRETLEAEGYTASVANSGRDALRIVASNESLELVLLDIDLGHGEDGIELASKILESSPRPIIFVTDKVDQFTLKRIRELDVYGCVDEHSGEGALVTATAIAFRRIDAERKASGETECRELRHRIRNNLVSLRSILEMQLEEANEPEAASVLRETIGRIESMSLLYRALEPGRDSAGMDAGEYVRTLVDAIVPLFPHSPGIAIDSDIEPLSLESKELYQLGIIINELLTNAMKYAFHGRDRGSVSVGLKRIDDDVLLSIQDDGNGFPSHKNGARKDGFGLKLVDALSRQLGGSFSVYHSGGTRCVVRTKFHAAAQPAGAPSVPGAMESAVLGASGSGGRASATPRTGRPSASRA